MAKSYAAMSDRLVEIASFPALTEAEFARNRLENAGITARLDGEAVANWLWHVGSALGGVKLLVKQEAAEQALEILGANSIATIDNDSDAFEENTADYDNDQQAEISPELIRAYRASIFGLVLLPPALNIYSMALLFRHKLLRPPRDWRANLAFFINLAVVLAVLLPILSIVFGSGELLGPYIRVHQSLPENGFKTPMMAATARKTPINSSPTSPLRGFETSSSKTGQVGTLSPARPR